MAVKVQPIKEADILKQCLQLLTAHGIPAWRSNSGAVKGEYTSKRTGKKKTRFVRMSGAQGQSDITGIIPKLKDGRSGVFLAIETKAEAGELSDKQRAYLDMILKASGIAIVVRDVKFLESVLRGIGAIQ